MVQSCQSLSSVNNLTGGYSPEFYASPLCYNITFLLSVFMYRLIAGYWLQNSYRLSYRIKQKQ